MSAASPLEHFDMAILANHAHKFPIAVLFDVVVISVSIFKVLNTHAPLYKASVVGLAKKTVVEFECGAF